MGLPLTSVTAAALARILGRRVDELTAAIREAIAALEAADRPSDQDILATLREAL